MKWVLVEEELDALYALASGMKDIKDKDALMSLRMKGLVVGNEDEPASISIQGEVVLGILQGETTDAGHQLEVTLEERPLRFSSLRPKEPPAKTIEDFF